MAKKTGRPTTYTPEIADIICSRLAEGESMRTISGSKDMPALSTMFLWLRKHEEFSEQYAKAKEESHSALFEEILDIADDGTNDWMLTNAEDNEGWKQNGESIQRSRLRVDARKWALSKIMPKKYGDKIQQEVSGTDGAPLIPVINVTIGDKSQPSS